MSEIIFGLLMALSFTGTMSATVAGGENVNAVLVAALGCNVAWGIVDGVMYVLTTAVERTRRWDLVARIRSLPHDEALHTLVRNLPDGIQIGGDDDAVELLVSRLRSLPEPGPRSVVSLNDFRAAASIFVLVVASTLPPSLPFLFIDDLRTAMRVSNGVALVMLFVIGARLGKYVGRSPWPMAFVMMLIGSVLVAVTIAFGG